MKRNYTGKIGERLKFLSRCLERRDFRYALNLKGRDLRYASTISGEFKFDAPFTLAFLAEKNDFWIKNHFRLEKLIGPYPFTSRSLVLLFGRKKWRRISTQSDRVSVLK